jgi:hypothetical protein
VNRGSLRLTGKIDEMLPVRGRSVIGRELARQGFVEWMHTQGAFIRYVQPGKPNQDVFFERLHRSLSRGGT